MADVPNPSAAAIGAAISLALALPAAPARADGTFFQLDAAEDTLGAVLNVTRGRLNYGATYTDYEGGEALSASVTHGFDLPGGAVLKIGPVVARTHDDDEDATDTEAGAKLSVERYSATGFGGLYLLGEVSSVESGWFLLAQTGFGASGFGAELSTGGSDTYSETTLAVTQRLNDGPFIARAGWRFEAEEVFFGFAINTF